MVATRKRPRISYAEDDGEDGGTSEGGAQTSRGNVWATSDKPTSDKPKGRRGRQVKAIDPLTQTRPPPVKRKSKLPSYNYAKILELPEEVLCTVFSYLEPLTLWAVSCASRKLNGLLTSKKKQNVWVKSLHRYTFEAPPDLLTANKAHANFQGPLQFYPFHLAESQPSGNVPSSPNDVSDDADAIKEGDVKDSSAKVIVRAPSCPEDVPEFVYIRYLYTRTCSRCGCECPLKRSSDYIKELWEIQERYCTKCIRYTQHVVTSPSSLIEDKERGIYSQNDYKILIDFTTFIMHEVTVQPILLNLCRITTDIPKVLRKHNGSIEERFQIYRQKSQTITSAEDFKSWLAEKDATIEAKHNLARHLREYAHLHESYAKYAAKIVPVVIEQQVDRYTELINKLARRLDVPQNTIRLLSQDSLQFQKRLDSLLSIKNLDTDDFGAIQASLKGYVDWLQLNPQARDRAWMPLVYTLYKQSILTMSTSVNSNVLLAESDFSLLPEVRKLTPGGGEYSLEGITDVAKQSMDRLIARATLKTALIIDNLEDKLAERQSQLAIMDVEDPAFKITGPAVETKVVMHEKETSSAPALPEEGNMANEVEDESDKEQTAPSTARLNGQEHTPSQFNSPLDHPSAIFECTVCTRLLTAAEVLGHPCVGNDLGHQTYGDFLSGSKVWRCKPVGYQESRVVASMDIGILADKLKAAVQAFTKDREWKYSKFTLPKTHEAAAVKNSKAWLFSCPEGKCHDKSCKRKWKTGGRNSWFGYAAMRSGETISPKTYNKMLMHLLDRAKKEGVAVQDIPVSDIHVHAGRYDR